MYILEFSLDNYTHLFNNETLIFLAKLRIIYELLKPIIELFFMTTIIMLLFSIRHRIKVK